MTSVSIITRTKNREILLPRALESVSAQSYRDFVWVIVNDGGRPEPVEAVAAQGRALGLSVKVVHNLISQGMEAASNVGIRASDSKFIVIHDDDDTWQPTFLENAVGFLSSDNGRRYGGVVTHSIKVDEIIDNNTYRIWSRVPFNGYLESVELFSMAKGNLFPPISFLFRREYYDQIGGFDEMLSVLGDWDFNLRFLMIGDIAVLPKLLANYHHRIALHDSNYGNTIIHGVNRHKEYDAIIRNRLLRQDLAAKCLGLGYLVNLAKELEGLRTRSLIWRFKCKFANTVLGHYFSRVFSISIN